MSLCQCYLYYESSFLFNWIDPFGLQKNSRRQKGSQYRSSVMIDFNNYKQGTCIQTSGLSYFGTQSACSFFPEDTSLSLLCENIEIHLRLTHVVHFHPFKAIFTTNYGMPLCLLALTSDLALLTDATLLTCLQYLMTRAVPTVHKCVSF